jgi:hypothetical protein
MPIRMFIKIIVCKKYNLQHCILCVAQDKGQPTTLYTQCRAGQRTTYNTVYSVPRRTKDNLQYCILSAAQDKGQLTILYI